MTCLVSFQIKIKQNLGSNEIVGLVGNIKELGKWELENAIQLKPGADNSFSCQVAVPLNSKILYRYFIALNTTKDNKKVLLLQSTEASLTLRNCVITDESNLNVDDGFYGEINGNNAMSNGFLSGQSEMRVCISSPNNYPFVEFNQSFSSKNSVDSKKLYVKPVSTCSHISEKFVQNIPLNFNIIEDKPYKCVEIPKGEKLHLTYILQHLDADEISLKLEVYSGSDANNVTLLGTGAISAACLSSTCKILKIPLLDQNHVSIGTLRVPCLLIHTYPYTLSIEESYSNYWKKKAMIHCGHRGSGNSFTSKKISNKYENTIDSFVHAGANGGKFVEFDVQLSKDGIPVVYHDLTTCVPVEKRADKSSHLVEIPVYQMTLNQLKELRMRQLSQQRLIRTLDYDHDDLDATKQPFPTLKEVLEQVSIKVGFNIEIKYPALDQKGNYENGLKHFIDPNIFCDAILRVVFEHAGKRKIIFSSFEVNICIMLRRKQHKYPVLFLTNGNTDHYTPMLDLREKTNEMAIGVAMAEGLLGINSLSKDVYKTPEIVKHAHNAGLVFACYGDDVGDNLKIINDAKVDIAIYDRIYEQNTEKK